MGLIFFCAFSNLFVKKVVQDLTSGGLLGVWGKWMKHAKYIYNIQDFNPEQVLAVGYTKSKLITDAMMWFDKFSCKRSDLVITVGRDLVETVENRFKGKKIPKTVMINNWIDENEIYAGVFALGYCDGMYLQYGGLKISTVKDNQIESDFGNLIIILSTASVIVFFAGIFRKDMVILLFAIGLFFYDILGMIRMLFQAVGEYGFYSKSLNAEKILILLSNLFFFDLGCIACPRICNSIHTGC